LNVKKGYGQVECSQFAASNGLLGTVDHRVLAQLHNKTAPGQALNFKADL